MKALITFALIWGLAANAQTDQAFRGTISNLGTEPAPYIPPPPPVEDPPPAPKPAMPVRPAPVVTRQASAGSEDYAEWKKRNSRPSIEAGSADGNPCAASGGCSAESYTKWVTEPEAPSYLAQPPQSPYLAAPQAVKPKMTRRQKWLRAAQIITAVSAGAALGIRCQQLRQKSIFAFTAGDYQDLRWCEAHGF